MGIANAGGVFGDVINNIPYRPLHHYLDCEESAIKYPICVVNTNQKMLQTFIHPRALSKISCTTSYLGSDSKTFCVSNLIAL